MWLLVATLSVVKAVNLRELKNRLGGYVREVRAGEIILVTDRGTVVAELRPPLHDEPAPSRGRSALEQLAKQGKVRLGEPNTPDAYPRVKRQVAAGLVERLIDEGRGE